MRDFPAFPDDFEARGPRRVSRVSESESESGVRNRTLELDRGLRAALWLAVSSGSTKIEGLRLGGEDGSCRCGGRGLRLWRAFGGGSLRSSVVSDSGS